MLVAVWLQSGERFQRSAEKKKVAGGAAIVAACWFGDCFVSYYATHYVLKSKGISKVISVEV